MEGDIVDSFLPLQNRISIHSLRMEGDFSFLAASLRTVSFQSTPSAWRETAGHLNYFCNVVFQSTPSAWRETVSAEIRTAEFVISIHSLRMEGDQLLLVSMLLHQHFNPLPPHGGRLELLCYLLIQSTFQSTPSAWRETYIWQLGIGSHIIFQSTPSAWRETRCCRVVKNWNIFQSTPSAWRETLSMASLKDNSSFQSTPSAWRET